MKEQIINILIREHIDELVFDSENFEIILKKGFKGYENYSFIELLKVFHFSDYMMRFTNKREKFKKFGKQIKTAMRLKKMCLIYPFFHYTQ